MTSPINLFDVALCDNPFEHFTLASVFSPEFNYLLLEWFEKTAPWELVETDFYEQYEFSFWDVNLPQEVSRLCKTSTVENLCSSMEKIFGAKLDYKRVDITAHKLVTGQRIRVHNDFIPNQETHRLIIQINRGWTEEMGGLLMLFESENPEDVTHVINPANNTAFGFAISQKSFHAVSKVYEGDRFTLVFSFYSK